MAQAGRIGRGSIFHLLDDVHAAVDLFDRHPTLAAEMPPKRAADLDPDTSICRPLFWANAATSAL